MALTVNDYQLVARTHHDAQGIEMANVFYYKNVGGTKSAEDLATSFYADVWSVWRNCISQSVKIVDLYVFSLTNEADFIILPNAGGATYAGTRATEILPLFNGWYFQLGRPTREVNHGRKTFSGIAEGDTVNGAASATLVTNLNLLEEALYQPISTAGTWQLCIAKTALVPAGELGKLKRVPDTLFPVQFVNYVKISTQNTRKE